MRGAVIWFVAVLWLLCSLGPAGGAATAPTADGDMLTVGPAREGETLVIELDGDTFEPLRSGDDTAFITFEPDPCGYIGVWSEDEQACIVEIQIVGSPDASRPETILRVRYVSPDGFAGLAFEDDITRLWDAP